MPLNLTDEFTLGYVECLLWAESGDEESTLGREAWVGEISDEFASAIYRDLHRFRLACSELIDSSDGSWEQAGHDFWLTRNGHGAGFWDREELWGVEGARLLTLASKVMGEVYIYRGDDGAIYA